MNVINGWKRQTLCHVVVAAWAIVCVSVASGQGFKSAPPEQSVQGLTVAEYFAQQQQRHAWLTRDMPDGTLATRIGIGLTRDELLDLERRAPAAGEPLRIGIVKSLSPALDVSGLAPKAQSNRISQVAGGSFQTTDDGGYVWAISIGSEGADGIRVHFRNFSLPANAEMYFFNLAGEAHGPYQAQGRNGNGDFWTDTVFSDSGVLLLRHFGPASEQDQRNVSFVIDKVGHIGRGFPTPKPQGHNWTHDQCGNASCVLDANCNNTTNAPANPAIDAVAKMEWIRGAFIFTCTGGLIADTDTTEQRNLFLTAHHCLSKKRNASNLETFFFYTTTSCEGSCPGSPAAHTTGATVLKSNQNGDFTLLELSQDPPAGTTFLGFNNSAIANTPLADLYRISNPNFGPQVFSHHKVDTGAPTCISLPRGEFIYSADHDGATDGGSSGAPVVNSNSEIVGQLFGCCGTNCGNVCTVMGNSTVDGALAFYYEQVAEFLDPQVAGACSTDPECDDGLFCNGAETCTGGSCQSGSNPCPGQGCDEASDQCVACGGNKAMCSVAADCCSGNCRTGRCRGN